MIGIFRIERNLCISTHDQNASTALRFIYENVRQNGYCKQKCDVG